MAEGDERTGIEGSTVVVIGGSSGIGLATARAALDRGANVAITGRSSSRLADAVATLDHRARGFELDSLDEPGTEAMFAELGEVDHVFVAAGSAAAARLSDDTSQLRPALDTRVWGSVIAARAAAPRMPSTGSITFCSGTSSLRPWKGSSSIGAASCGAVEALARALAVELAPRRVNAIVPGLVDTPLVASAFGDQHAQRMVDAARALPVGRVGQPEDIADAVMFLMRNPYVTGISLLIDGGRMLA